MSDQKKKPTLEQYIDEKIKIMSDTEKKDMIAKSGWKDITSGLIDGSDFIKPMDDIMKQDHLIRASIYASLLREGKLHEIEESSQEEDDEEDEEET
jgi:hypothetical protein